MKYPPCSDVIIGAILILIGWAVHTIIYFFVFFLINAAIILPICSLKGINDYGIPPHFIFLAAMIFSALCVLSALIQMTGLNFI